MTYTFTAPTSADPGLPPGDLPFMPGTYLWSGEDAMRNITVILLYDLEHQMCQFENENQRYALINKVEAVEKMITEGNLRGAYQKITSDIMDKVEKWIIQDDLHRPQIEKQLTSIADAILNPEDQRPCCAAVWMCNGGGIVVICGWT